MQTLGILVIVSSLYKGILGIMAVLQAMYIAIAIGGYYCHKQGAIICRICVSQGVSNGKLKFHSDTIFGVNSLCKIRHLSLVSK